MGGAGKTTLARIWSKSFSKQNPNVFMWELNAENQHSLQQSFKELAKALAQTPQLETELNVIENMPHEDEKAKLRYHFVQKNLKTVEKWVLTFDNVANLSGVLDYLPQNPVLWGNGQIIITTRNSHFKHTDIISYNNIIFLDALSEDDSFSLFSKLRFPNTYQTLISGQKEEIKEFVKNLPPYPLDISVAAKYMMSNNVSYEDYLNELNTQKKEFYSVQEEMLKETSSYIKTRYSILTLAFKKIIERDQKFENFLTMLTMIESQNIPRKLLERYYKKSVVNAFISELKKHSLITEEGNMCKLETFSIHRSTQDICNVYLMQNNQFTSQNLSIIAIGNIFATFLNELIDVENYIHIGLVVPHCKKILKSDLLTNSVKGIISVTLGWTYFCLGNDILAKQFLEDGIIYLKTNDGKKDNKKDTYSKGVKTEKIITDSVLSHVAKQKYSEDIHIVQATAYLGIIALRGGEFEKAKKLLEWCRPIYQLSNDYVGYTRVLTFSGLLYTLLNDYSKAKETLLASIHFCKKQNVRKANLARAFSFLGYQYKEEGDYVNAKNSFNESAKLYKDKILLAWTKAHIAGVENELGNQKNAQKILHECLDVYKEQGASQHISLGWILPYLGSVYRKRGNYTEAEKFFKEAITIYKMFASETHINLGKSFPAVHLGKLYRKIGLYDKAKILLDESKVEHTKMYGENNSRTMWGDMALAELYIDTKQYVDAKKLIESCLTYYQKTLLPSHYKIGKALSNLGIVCYKSGDTKNALSYLTQGLIILEKHYGPNHFETTSTLRNIGEVYIVQNDLKKAEDFINKSYEILKNNKHC